MAAKKPAQEESQPDRQDGDGLPIIQYWHDGSTPDDITALFNIFRRLNPDFRHMAFNRNEAAEFIEWHFGPRELAAFEACAVPAMQADYFRYSAVLALGGIYSDADLECYAALRPLLPRAGQGRLFCGRGGNVINGIFAFGSPGHRFLELVLEIATVNIERRRFDTVYRSTGPPIFAVLCWLRQAGSIEALVKGAAELGIGDYVATYCETITDYGGVSVAFDGIEIAPVAKQDQFLGPPTLPYSHSESHWTKFKGSIYRPKSNQ